MKKRFLSILLAAALVLSGGVITAPSSVSAATISDSIKQSIPTMSEEQLVELLEIEHAKNPNYVPEDTTKSIAELCNNCKFITDPETIKIGTMEGEEILWLNPAEVEILRTRFPERFTGITAASICLQAGYFGEDIVLNEQLVKATSDQWMYQPNFEGIVEMLSRGPYTIKLTGSISTNCTKSVKVGQKYTTTVNYKVAASDGGDFDLSNITVSVDYNRKKPTKLAVTCYLSDGQEISKTLTIKMTSSLQKKIKAGTVVISGSNYGAYGDSAEIYTTKNMTVKSGKVSLAFKFKKK